MFQSIPVVTRNLLIANVVLFGLQQIAGDWMIVHLALWPLGDPRMAVDAAGNSVQVGFQVWQLLSYGFLHGGFTHIAFNMFALWMFGGQVEELMGSRHFLIYYLTCVVGAAVAQLATVAMFTGGFYPTLGASGGVFGLLLAFGMFWPHVKIMPLFPPIPMPAWLFVTLYGALELFLGVTGTQAGVAHFAHLGGMAFGFILIQYWRGRLPIKPRRRLTR